MTTEHYPWCAGAQNNARPRSMQLIGPMCECAAYRKDFEKIKQWVASDEGKTAMGDLVSAIKGEGTLSADRIESQAADIERLKAEISDQKNTIRQMQNKINKAGGLALIKASHELIRATLAIKGEGKRE